MKKSPPLSLFPAPPPTLPSSALSLTNVLNLDKPRRQRSKRPRDTEVSNNRNGNARRSSVYRGVTRHRWTGRFEAHLWDKSSWNPIQNKKGRQGAYDDEEVAAHTYDLAALKYWGPETILNFPATTYMKEYEEMQRMSREEFLACLRRRSSGFSRGISKFRGVARHHHSGRWEARIGRVYGNKYLYLGTFDTEEEAAVAYDIAAMEHRGKSAVTNFDISRYLQPNNPNPLPRPPLVPRIHPQSLPHAPLLQPSQQQLEEPQATMGPPRPQLEPSAAHNTVEHVGIPDCMNEINWSIYIDPPGFDKYSELSLDCPSDLLQDLCGDDGFEEDIECLFDASELIIGGYAVASDGVGGSGSGNKDDGISMNSGAMEGKLEEGEKGSAAEVGEMRAEKLLTSQVSSVFF